MSNFAWAKGPSGVVLGGAAAAIVVGLGLYAANRLSQPSSAPTADPAVAELTQSAPAAGASETPADGQSEGAVEPAQAATDAPSDTAAPVPDESADNTAPTFDIVRVEPDGTTLVAGIAAARSEVEILLDGTPQDKVTSDDTGRFVSFLSLPPSTAPRVLRLRSTHSDGTTESEDEVIIAPAPATATAAAGTPPQTTATQTPEPEQAAETGLAALTTGPQPASGAEPAQAPDAQPLPVAVPAAGADQPPLEPESGAVDAAQAPTVLLSTASGIDVLQSPAGTATEPGTAPQVTDVVLDSITYEDDGNVILTGRGLPADSVRIYIDNAPVTSSRIRADGRWRATLPDVVSGTYTLRVDQVTAAGTVASRVESPFLREEPAMLAAAAALPDNAQVRAVTVQPGNTLWAIARDRYGEGTAYVRVFEANRDAIRDPDLIYPGQVFSIPEN